MHYIQNTKSGDTFTLTQGMAVTQPCSSEQVSALDADLNRISERQQQLLLTVVGYASMGLMVATLTLISPPKQPAAADAKAAPAQVTKPAAYAPDSNKQVVKAVKT
jgi:hypothetical protein